MSDGCASASPVRRSLVARPSGRLGGGAALFRLLRPPPPCPVGGRALPPRRCGRGPFRPRHARVDNSRRDTASPPPVPVFFAGRRLAAPRTAEALRLAGDRPL